MMKTFQSSVRDISDRKRLEQQLRAEKAKAEETTQTKSQFLSTMSHEIRTPMNAIIGLTNLMLEENPREDQAESLGLLKFSGENLLALINDILDFNKIEAGKVELENIGFNLKDIVQKHINLLKSRASNKGIELNLIMDERLPSAVSGDPTRLGQILNNLIGNAIKFTDQGAVTVSLSLIQQLGEENQIQFTVRDTGIGIPSDKLDSIFDNFSQASTDTTRKYGGTGLGLSIAQKLVQLMGGEIQVKSQLGVGTTFLFTIALKFMANKPASTLDNHAPSVMTREVSVLLVEDNKINQVVAGNFIKKWGMKLTIANDGVEALEMIKSKSYDVVLMDLQMPVMDGYEASQKIRQMDDHYFKTVPIIALSASAMLEEKEKAKEFGFNEFITKPFQPLELRESILQFVPKKKEDKEELRQAPQDKKTGSSALLKRDLAAQNIVHLFELKESLYQSLEDQSAEAFMYKVAKSKTTLAVLNNAEFNEIISTISEKLKGKQSLNTELLNNFFIKAESLRKELEAQMEISTAA
jgi:CheY-like chemotaxis protein/nitrogen-specific signal transduction histidine kinase